MRKIENLNVLPPVSPPPFFEWPLLATHCGILHQIKKPRKKREGTKFPFPSQRKREITQSLLLFYPSPKIPNSKCTFSRLSLFCPARPQTKRSSLLPPSLSFPMHLAVGARGRREFNSIRGFYDRKWAEEEGRTVVACVRP